jgi:RB1-inducible coiled-coil protein 1
MDAKTFVQDQAVLAQAFLNNQNSASNERDSSIYPDLCQAHQHQLMTMFKKHQHLDEIRRKCAKAKEELIGNLNSRLKWIIYVQHSVSETGNKLTVYKERLRRLRSQLEVVEQIHVAAEIYGEAVVEVVRRKKFSESYRKVKMSNFFKYKLLTINLHLLRNMCVIFILYKYKRCLDIVNSY